MSVINQMLRDLDARQASEQERAGLPPRLRTLPPTPVARSKQLRIFAAGMAAGAVMAGLLAGLFMTTGPAPAPATPALPAAVPAAAAPIDTAPTSATPAAEEALRLPTDADEMRLATWLTTSEPALVPAPAAAPPPIAKPKPEPVKPPPAPAPRETRPAAPPQPPAAEAQIDKRSKDGRAHDLAESEYNRGVQAVKRGENAAALPALQRALELEPAHAKARQALLSVLVGGKQWDAARQVAQTGLALDPTQSGLAMILARLQFEQGDTAAALDTLTRHTAHATGNADYQGLFAYLLQKQQRPTEAAQRFQAALALRPNEGRWWFGLGLALESAGRGGEAKEAYARAREVGNLPTDMAAVVEQKLR